MCKKNVGDLEITNVAQETKSWNCVHFVIRKKKLNKTNAI